MVVGHRAVDRRGNPRRDHLEKLDVFLREGPAREGPDVEHTEQALPEDERNAREEVIRSLRAGQTISTDEESSTTRGRLSLAMRPATPRPIGIGMFDSAGSIPSHARRTRWRPSPSRSRSAAMSLGRIRRTRASTSREQGVRIHVGEPRVRDALQRSAAPLSNLRRGARSALELEQASAIHRLRALIGDRHEEGSFLLGDRADTREADAERAEEAVAHEERESRSGLDLVRSTGG